MSHYANERTIYAELSSSVHKSAANRGSSCLDVYVTLPPQTRINYFTCLFTDGSTCMRCSYMHYALFVCVARTRIMLSLIVMRGISILYRAIRTTKGHRITLHKVMTGLPVSKLFLIGEIFWTDLNTFRSKTLMN